MSEDIEPTIPQDDATYQRATEVIELLSRSYKVKISLRFKSFGSGGLWIVQTMSKNFRHEHFPTAVKLMAKFVYNAHNVNDIIP